MILCMEFSLLKTGVSCVFEKIRVVFDDASMTIDDFVIDFPGEYEKSNILVEAEELGEHYIFASVIGGRKITYLPSSIDAITSDMITKIGDVDVLIIAGVKALKEVVEKIEPNVLLPYGPSRSTLLGAFGQTEEPLVKKVLKVADYDGEQMLCLSLVD